MSLQLKLIPIYIEDQTLVSLDDKTYETNLESFDLKDEFKENFYLNRLINEHEDKFGEKTIIPTPMKDKNLLIKALSSFAEKFKDRELLLDFVDTGSLSVQKSIRGTYNLCFEGFFRKEEIDEITSEILKEYSYDVQEITYEKVIKKIEENRLSIESENITDDDSIVITVSL